MEEKSIMRRIPWRKRGSFMYKATFLSAFFALLFLVPETPTLAAEENNQASVEIEEIIVDGTRLGQLRAETGTSVSIIDLEELEALGFRFAVDAIAAAPGVTVNQNGPFGGSASVRIRGAASEQTLVLVDGVPVNDPSTPGGGFNFARLDSDMIERIEILKGPQSSLWGSDAIGGVVSIVTRQPESGGGGDLFVDLGSFATRRGGASFEHAGDATDFRLAASTISSDGISKADEANGNTEADGYDSRTLAAKGGLDLAGGGRLQADLLTSAARADFDSFSSGTQGSVGDGPEVSETGEIAANVSLSLPSGALEHLLLAGWSDIERENFRDGASIFQAEGRRGLLRYQGTLGIDENNTLAFGAEHEQTETLLEETAIDSVFAVHEIKPAANLTLTGGLRADRHEKFGTETTARLGVAVQLNDNLILRASWGDGFKAPSLFQTTYFCCGAEAPNQELRPESSRAFDAGIEWFAPDRGAGIGATAFSQYTENLINFSFSVGGYENIAEVDSDGVEIYGSLALSGAFRLRANYAFVDARDGAGKALIRIPRHSGDLSLDYDAGGAWTGRLLLRHNGREDDRGDGFVDDWTRLDLTARYRIFDRLEMFVRLENLLDEHYQQILGYGTQGRSGSVGMRLRY